MTFFWAKNIHEQTTLNIISDAINEIYVCVSLMRLQAVVYWKDRIGSLQSSSVKCIEWLEHDWTFSNTRRYSYLFANVNHWKQCTIAPSYPKLGTFNEMSTLKTFGSFQYLRLGCSVLISPLPATLLQSLQWVTEKMKKKYSNKGQSHVSTPLLHELAH